MECTKIENAFRQALERRNACARPRPHASRAGLPAPDLRGQSPRVAAQEIDYDGVAGTGISV